MKKIAGEFKEFIMRGNVMDLAVGVIIGGAFQAIVNAFINDLIMPFIGLLTGGINFNEQFLILKLPEGVEASQVTYANASELGASIWAGQGDQQGFFHRQEEGRGTRSHHQEVPALL